MAAKRKKQTAARKAPDPRAALVGRHLGVPTSFFNVQVEGARYLARVKAPHRDKKEMLWFKFAQAGYGAEAYAPETRRCPEPAWRGWWERRRTSGLGPLYTERMSDTIQNTKQKVPHAECKQPVPRGIKYLDARRAPNLAGRSQGY